MSFHLSEPRPLRILTTVRPGRGETPSLASLEGFSRLTDVAACLYCPVYDSHLSTWRSGATCTEQDLKDFLIEHEKANLLSMQREAGGLCASCEVRAEWHHPAATGIVQAAHDFEADAVFLAASRFTHNLDYHDWEVLTRVSAPVLICNTLEFRPYRRILVAVDPSHSHQKAREIDARLLNEASALAALFGAEIHAVHAYPSSRSYVTPETLVPAELLEVWREQHEEAVADLVKDFNVEDIHLVPDHPRDAILKTAEQIDADLLVLGVTSRSRIADLIVGHTAAHVINHSQCDVLGLRAE